MPTYEYVCRGCNEHVEVVQSFKDDPLTTCGLCGGQLRKVFSAAGIIFKGAGYYVTDTRSEQAKRAAGGKEKSDGEKKADSAGSDAGSSADGGSSSTGSGSSSTGSGSSSTGSGSSSTAAESA